MLFLWTTTKLGKIWLDGDSIRQIVSRRLPEGYYCQEVSFIGDQNLLNIYISLPEGGMKKKRQGWKINSQTSLPSREWRSI